jgi:hypothetical protein
MTDATDNGGQAFPYNVVEFKPDGSFVAHPHPGMSLRQYAAIKLGVPDSGLPWLDDMINASNRDRFARQALPAVIAATISGRHFPCPPNSPEDVVKAALATDAYELADAMLAARKGGQ